jgi:hypothetical protein
MIASSATMMPMPASIITIHASKLMVDAAATRRDSRSHIGWHDTLFTELKPLAKTKSGKIQTAPLPHLWMFQLTLKPDPDPNKK